jgi:tetratricopeptide (TPR) repeat protein
MSSGMGTGDQAASGTTRVHWDDLARVVDQALDLELADRPAFVAQTCSGDPALRGEVERLLSATERAGNFLDQPLATDLAPLVSWVARQESQTLAAGTRFGAYEVTGLLGRGGMAAVYLAVDHKHHRTVAVKVFDAGVGTARGREWFLREIDIAAGLHHPHVLPLHDSGEVDGRLYYVMPHVEGESLRQRLSREGQIPLAHARRIVREVAGALDYAHRQHVVHRDIKPENILLQEDQAIVADFGIARAIDPSLSEADGAETIPALGTPAYMSPEQATRHGEIDGRTDIYALGCVVHEMLTGAPPFTGATVQAILEQHAASPVPSLRGARPDLPLALEQAVTRALQKAPADRFATAGELVDAIDAAVTAKATRPRLRTIAVGTGVALAVTVALLTRGERGQTAELDATLVAIAPFRVAAAGPSLAYLREGMVDLLAAKLAMEAGSRPVNPRSTLSAWHRLTGTSGQEIPADAPLQLARHLGAGRLIDGSVVGTPGDLTLSASLLQSPDGRTVATASVEGTVDSLSPLLDRLVARLLMLDAGVDVSRLPAMSTSLPAIRAFLAGRAAFRMGKLDEAFRQFRDATVLDSTFALAAFELVHVSLWLDWGDDARRGLRLAEAGRSRLSREDLALLAAWPLITRFPTGPELIGRWRVAAEEYPDRAEIWYWLGDAYYHAGRGVGLDDRLGLAQQAFRRGWALDSANAFDSLAPARSPLLAEPLKHMVEIAQMKHDTALVLRLARIGLSTDSTRDRAWYFRWHQALALGDSARRAFWADSDRIDARAIAQISAFITVSGSGSQDWLRATRLDTRNEENGRPGVTAESHLTVLLNGGRPHEVHRMLALPDDSTWGVVGKVMGALYWEQDTSGTEDVVRRLALLSHGHLRSGRSGMQQLRALCTTAIWRAAHADFADVATVIRRLPHAIPPAISGWDSIRATQYASLCAALLDAMQSGGLHLPDAPVKLAAADEAARTFNAIESVPANLIVARLGEAAGDLNFALRALRRRAGDAAKFQPYLSTFLREEGRVAALTGDTVGAIGAYQHFLMLRPNPESEMREGTEHVRAELAKLMRQRES